MRRPPTLMRPLALAGIALAAACGPRIPPGVEPPETARQPVNYYVRVPQGGAATYGVTLATDGVRRDSVDFVLPAWVPGQYGQLANQVQAENFSARDGRGDPIATRRIGSTRWRLYPGGKRYITVAYEIVPDPPSEPLPFRTRLGLHDGYALGAGLFGVLQGYEGRPVRVSFDLPVGWRASAPLQTEGPNQYSAPRYGLLPAIPFVVGDRYREYRLFQRGRSHQVTVQGAPSTFAPESLLAIVDETIRTGTDFFGDPPYDRYLAAIHFVPPEEGGIGGTGSAAGMAIFLPEMESAGVRAAGVETMLLHQYLHAWLPGVFGPRELVQPDWSVAPRSRDLWLVEGACEYYARLLPVRGRGESARARFYAEMGALVSLWRELGGGDDVRPAGLAAPVIRGADERAVARLVAGGALTAFLVDLAIREETHGLRGLDQLLYYLQKSLPPGGYPEGEPWAAAGEALGISAGTLAPLEGGSTSLEAGLARAGLRLVERGEARRTLGARLVVAPGTGFLVAAVDPGGTAASAGLREGDRLLAINDTPIAPEEALATRYALTTYIAEARPGTPIRFSIERAGSRSEARGQVRESRARHLEIRESSSPSPRALLVRASLFRSAASPGR